MITVYTSCWINFCLYILLYAILEFSPIKDILRVKEGGVGGGWYAYILLRVIVLFMGILAMVCLVDCYLLCG